VWGSGFCFAGLHVQFMLLPFQKGVELKKTDIYVFSLSSERAGDRLAGGMHGRGRFVCLFQEKKQGELSHEKPIADSALMQLTRRR